MRPQAGIKLQDPAALAFEGVNRGSAEQKLRLVAAMKEIDALGAAGAKPLDQARVAAIDKKVKAARARMPQAGKAQTGKSAAAKVRRGWRCCCATGRQPPAWKRGP